MGWFDTIKTISDPFGLEPISNSIQRKLNAKSNTPLTDAYGADAVAALDEAMPSYRESYANAGGANGLQGRSYERWLADHMAAHPEDDGAKLLNNPAALKKAVAAAQAAANDGQPPSLEQGFGDYVLNNYIYPDITADASRRDVANGILNSYSPAIAAGQALVKNLAGQPDAQGYLAAHPDAAAAYAQTKTFDPNALLASNPGLQQYYDSGDASLHATYPTVTDFVKAWASQPGNEQNGAAGMVSTVSPEDFVQQYQQNVGSQKGYTLNYGPSKVYQQEAGASDQAAASQQLSLHDQLETMKQSVDTQLAAKASNLQQLVDTMSKGLTTFTEAQRNALADQIKSEFSNLETEVASRQDNLKTALSTMGTAITDEDKARQAALQTELTKLNAAQAPLNAVRVEGAKAAMTAINMGTESTRDDLAAKMAQQGYVGTSSGDEMALARATAAGRQNAAQQMSNAQIANETDNRGILSNNATQATALANEIAKAKTQLSGYGATEGRTIGDYAAAGNKTIGDYNASETRGISANDANARLGLTQTQATQTQGLNDSAADANKSISDYGASEKRGIQDTNTSQKLGFFTNDINRQIASLSLPAASAQQQFDLLNSADNYSQSGLQRAFGNLNFFNTGTSQAPTAQGNTVQPNTTMGSALQNLGAGIVSAAGSYGISQIGKNSTPQMSYSDFLKNYPTSLAAGGGSIPNVDSSWSFSPGVTSGGAADGSW